MQTVILLYLHKCTIYCLTLVPNLEIYLARNNEILMLKYYLNRRGYFCVQMKGWYLLKTI